jgi:uncharacterized protein YodC (DUF2158 family)
MVKKRTPEAVAEEAASQCCSCEIAVGGTVYLKSGGPKMTVSGMGWAPGTVTTVWFDGGRLGGVPQGVPRHLQPPLLLRRAVMEIKYLDTKTLIDDGYLQEANRQFFHPLGLALEVKDGTIRVWDYRDDPEGINFADKVDLRAKADKVLRLEGERYATRKQALGYWIQPFLR